MSATAEQRWALLREQVRELCDLEAVIGLLGWDEETYAPQAARGPRGRQVATLETLAHRILVAPSLGELIDQLTDQLTGELTGQGAARNEQAPEQMIELRLLRRRREQAVRVPEALVRALAQARSRALDAWERARVAGDYAVFAAPLQEVLSLTRERATALQEGPPYDALLDEHEPGMKNAVLGPILAGLRRDLVALLDRLPPAAPPPFAAGALFDEDRQWRFTLRLLGDLGFDFSRGRQDRSTHPFTLSAGEHDIRVTTRIDPHNPLTAIFSTAHEAGHALYDQGYPPRLFGTLLASAPSIGMHEAQARLWENQIARSLPFWEHYLPILRQEFPAQLGAVGVADFHRAVIAVRPGPIRVGADEVTYNLHILLRHELELALIEGDLRAADLPGAWNERALAYLGVRPKNDLEGCLQDVHWALGSLGYFPTYALGNLCAAQLMAAYERQRPGLWDDIRRGDFAPLRTWLREHVHRRGHLVSTAQLMRDATGADLSAAPFLAYLDRRYT